MNLIDIQEYYDSICRKYNTISVKVSFVCDTDYRGLYVEIPFPKIYLNKDYFDLYTVYHEIFHHIRPDLMDGLEFETLLGLFIKQHGFIY